MTTACSIRSPGPRDDRDETGPSRGLKLLVTAHCSVLAPDTSVAAELAAADKLIYHWRPARREYGRGVQQALMWAQYATAMPPAPTLRSPLRTNR